MEPGSEVRQMIKYSARQLLEAECGSRTYITEGYRFIPDGRVVFSPAVAALKRTVLGDPRSYWLASALMLAAEMEHQAQQADLQEGGALDV